VKGELLSAASADRVDGEMAGAPQISSPYGSHGGPPLQGPSV
jgi:hypothetical protein